MKHQDFIANQHKESIIEFRENHKILVSKIINTNISNFIIKYKYKVNLFSLINLDKPNPNYLIFII